MLIEFYKKEGKNLQIKSSKESLLKSQDSKLGKTEEKRRTKRERTGEEKIRAQRNCEQKVTKLKIGMLPAIPITPPLNALIYHLQLLGLSRYLENQILLSKIALKEILASFVDFIKI